MARSHAATFALVLVGCASVVSNVPECPPVEEMPPPPTVECRLDPAFAPLELRLAQAIGEVAGPLLVRIEFDAAASVGSVCADRTSAETQRRARTRVASRLDEITGSPPGPACLAGTRLDFNRREAGVASAKQAVLECSRKAKMFVRSGANDPSNPAWADARRGARNYMACLDRSQKELGQIWFLDRLTATRAQIFHQTPSSSPREETARACSEKRQSSESEFFGGPIGIARPGAELDACVRAYGWEP